MSRRWMSSGLVLSLALGASLMGILPVAAETDEAVRVEQLRRQIREIQATIRKLEVELGIEAYPSMSAPGAFIPGPSLWVPSAEQFAPPVVPVTQTPTHPAPTEVGLYRVAKPVYTLRLDARADALAVATLRQGQDVTVLWFTQGGQWAKVRLASGKEGYVNVLGIVPADSAAVPAPAHASPPTPAPVAVPAPVVGTYRVTRLVNFRMDARANSQSLGFVKVGQEVTVLWFAQGNQWARVRLSNGSEGYVHVSVLEKVQ